LYYQAYNEDGRRTVAHSTGEATRTATIKKCNRRKREFPLSIYLANMSRQSAMLC
jgi:hypothetical protein